MQQTLRELPVGARQWGVHIRIPPASSAPKEKLFQVGCNGRSRYRTRVLTDT